MFEISTKGNLLQPAVPKAGVYAQATAPRAQCPRRTASGVRRRQLSRTNKGFRIAHSVSLALAKLPAPSARHVHTSTQPHVSTSSPPGRCWCPDKQTSMQLKRRHRTLHPTEHGRASQSFQAQTVAPCAGDNTACIANAGLAHAHLGADTLGVAREERRETAASARCPQEGRRRVHNGSCIGCAGEGAILPRVISDTCGAGRRLPHRPRPDFAHCRKRHAGHTRPPRAWFPSTHRMLPRPRKSMTTRSRPTPPPPWGGTPWAKAST